MPIETTNYLMLGLAVSFVTIGLHLISFPLRTRNLKADLAALQSVPKSKPAAKKATSKKSASKKAAVKKAAKKTVAKKAAKKTAKRATR